MDRILISELPLNCQLGVTAEERATAQAVVLDLELSLDLSRPAATDAIEDTVNYSSVCAVAEEIASARPYHLIESLAETIVRRLFLEFPVEQVRILVRKPAALARRGAAFAAVELVRKRDA
jgi:dihydroneopterin aldolase